MKIVNTQEFNELMNEKAVLVDFFATWCGPCKMLSPVLEGVAEKMKDKVTIVKVDVDRSPDLAAKFGVMSVPTMIMFKNANHRTLIPYSLATPPKPTIAAVEIKVAP